MLIPLEKFLSLLFSGAYSLTNNYGLSLLALSLMVNLILLPVYMPLEKWKKKKAKEQAPMKKELEAIKRAYKGRERYFYTRAVHRRHHFHPIESVILSLGLLIQIPFFLAAYQMLSHYSALEGVSFWFIQNLGAADSAAQFAGIPINVLPLIMTILNVISAFLYTKEPSERKPLWILAAVFLFLLYKSPAGLVLYWTANNIFALIKQLPEIPKRLRNVNLANMRKSLASIGHKGYYLIPLFALYLSFVSFYFPNKLHPSKVIIPSTVMILLFLQELIHLFIMITLPGKGRKRRLIAAGCFLVFLIYHGIFGLEFIPELISSATENLSAVGIFKRRIILFALQAATGLFLTFPFIYRSARISSKPIGNGFQFQLQGHFTGVEEIILSIAYLAGSWLLWIPLMIYNSLAGEFSFSAGEVITSGLWPFVLVTIIGTGMTLLIPGRWRFIPWVMATSISSLAFLNAFLIPYDFGFLTGFDLSRSEILRGTFSSYLIDFFLIISVIVLMSIAVTRWRKGVLSFMVMMNIVLIGQGVYTLTNTTLPSIVSEKIITRTPGTEEPHEYIPLSETDDNVVVFMMDMFTGGYLFEILQDTPSLKDTFDGFTWFPNTMAVATNTIAGQPALMGGNEFSPSQVNRRNIGHSVREEIGRSYQVMIDKAQDANLEVNLIEPFMYDYLSDYWPSLKEEKVKVTILDDYIGNQEASYLAERNIGNGGSKSVNLLRAISLFRIVPYGFKSMIYANGFWLPLGGELVYQSYFTGKLPEWLFMKNLPELTHGEAIKGQYYFITSLLAHHPYALSKEGELLSDRFPDSDQGDNRQGRNPYYSADWSLKIIGDWCDALKEKGLYDNTKIIIVSDHGNYRSSDNAAPRKNDSALSSLGLDKVYHTAFNPILMVKDFNSRNPLKIDSQLMSNSDTSTIAFTPDSTGWINALDSDRIVEGQFTRAWNIEEHKTSKYESFGVFQVSGDFYDIKNWKRVEE